MMARALVAVLATLCLAGCANSPTSLGITGPSAPPPPVDVDDSVLTRPGLPDTGTYAPSIGPTMNGGRYFNYN